MIKTQNFGKQRRYRENLYPFYVGNYTGRLLSANFRHTSGRWYPGVFLSFMWIPAFAGMTAVCLRIFLVIPAEAGIHIYSGLLFCGSRTAGAILSLCEQRKYPKKTRPKTCPLRGDPHCSAKPAQIQLAHFAALYLRNVAQTEDLLKLVFPSRFGCVLTGYERQLPAAVSILINLSTLYN